MNIFNSSLYKEYQALREEVMKHKWYESEKAGYDIGFGKALIDWTVKFKTQWMKARRFSPQPTPSL